MLRLPWHFCLLLLVSIKSTSGSIVDGESYHEELNLRPLPDGKVLSHFDFNTITSLANWQGSLQDDSIQVYHTSLLPRSLAAIIRAYDVEEVHLSLTAGRWDYARWGETYGHGSSSGGEIHAWLSAFDNETDSAVLQKWTGLTNSLGGLFCSSLNKLDEKMTVSPRYTFSPSNIQSEGQPFFHALLPLERPCTENLTPFVSLLPCRSAAGLAELLNPHKLFDANWQRLMVHITRDIFNQQVSVKLSMEVVQDPVRMTLSAGSQPRRDWTLDSLFGRAIKHECPVATSSTIKVISGKHEEALLEPAGNPGRLQDTDSALYDLHNVSKPFNLQMRWPVLRSEGFEYPRSYTPAPVYAERINTGYGLERATLGIAIYNSEQHVRTATWLEEWPSWIKVYMHTLQVTVSGKTVAQDTVVRDIRYRQAHPRGRPTLLEAGLSLPPTSVVRITVDIDRAYLRYTDYPPDPHRGFDVPSGVILVHGTVGDESSGHKAKRIYTTSTLLDMPTPDFSMPYNVIILTCTVIALFFGSVFNMMTRSWLLVDIREPKAVAEDKASANGSETTHTHNITEKAEKA